MTNDKFVFKTKKAAISAVRNELMGSMQRAKTTVRNGNGYHCVCGETGSIRVTVTVKGIDTTLNAGICKVCGND
jgi:hypothetical protein